MVSQQHKHLTETHVSVSLWTFHLIILGNIGHVLVSADLVD